MVHRLARRFAFAKLISIPKALSKSSRRVTIIGGITDTGSLYAGVGEGNSAIEARAYYS